MPVPSLIELDISERFAFADGHAFGDAGSYERLKGRARFAVDPTAQAQAGIVDLDKAPRGADGRVTFTADISILKPSDLARSNRRLFFDWGNRGNIRCLQFFNDAPGSNDPRTRAHAGNGFLLRRGYSLVWCAWQADLLAGDHRFLLDVPVATDNGRPVTGPVRVEYIADQAGITTFPLSSRASTRSHPAVSLDTRKATLTRRRYPGDPRQPIPHDQWMFARVEGGTGLDNQGAEFSVIPSDTHIHIPKGFETGWIYELVYEGRDPLVLGLGHVAVRDLVSFLRHGETGNPLRAGSVAMEKAYGWGRSQTGRCIRDFIHRGFNADAAGRRVFDGLLPHVSGAGLMWLSRFANVIVAAGQQYEDHYNPADQFPFTYAPTTNHNTGKSDAIMKRPATDPLVLHTQTATEYWQRRGSLVHTDTKGNDVALPENVRAYLWSSSQHFADPRLAKPARGVCQNVVNVVWTSMLFRAMLDALDAWATKGTPPPASRIPRRSDGTLVTLEEWRKAFPAIPGVMTPRSPSEAPLLDWGPEASRGILIEPPQVLAEQGYAVLVPQVDKDGNDIAGVRAPMVEAPLATYTGWNLRTRGVGHGAMHEFTGSTLPFPGTAEEARATGDPRRSIAERYGTQRGYAEAIVAAARRLVADRLMLEEDVERCAASAANWHAPRHDVGLP
ncbi:MAG TPA: alpha/beta hydrolase domain-containing protein [Hyphomicrobiaceae bacterium]|nr:alpha/beta hydrolase domain-containing protein [Hyphomicrobiaceae bacterium]